MSQHEMRRYCAGWMDRRSHRLRFGGLLVIIGLVWLAQRTGWMPTDYLGPVVLVVLGFWFLSTSRLFKNGSNATPKKE